MDAGRGRAARSSWVVECSANGEEGRGEVERRGGRDRERRGCGQGIEGGKSGSGVRQAR